MNCMTLNEFNEIFPTNESCLADFRQRREILGITCAKCNGKNHKWLANRLKWECSDCKSTTALKSGTLIERSHLTIRDWYLAIAIIMSSKRCISSLEIQRRLGKKRYAPIWRMTHKIRYAMKFFQELEQGANESVERNNFQDILFTSIPEEI
jgi:hypothetical protein